LSRLRELVGKFFWHSYQFMGKSQAPAFLLDLTDGLAEFFLDGNSLVYCIHHCWHCSEYATCKYRKGTPESTAKREITVNATKYEIVIPELRITVPAKDKKEALKKARAAVSLMLKTGTFEDFVSSSLSQELLKNNKKFACEITIPKLVITVLAKNEAEARKEAGRAVSVLLKPKNFTEHDNDTLKLREKAADLK
jgi:hypothetical protein